MQADAQAKIIGAPLLPEVDFAGFAQRVRPPGGPERNVFQAALNASYEIDFWGKNRAASRAAEQTAVATRFDKEVVVLSTIAAVGNSYFLVLTAQDRLRIARQNFEAANRVLTLIKQRFDAGTASQLDVAQQQSLVNQVRATIPLFDQDLRQNIAILAVLIGRPPVQVVVKGGSLYRLTIPRVTPGLPSELLFQRPDIRAAEADLASADASVEVRARRLLPEHFADRPGRLPEQRAQAAVRAAERLLQSRRQHHQPLLDGFLLEGQLELTQGRQFELLKIYCQSILAELPRRRDCAHRHRRRGRARATAATGRREFARGLQAGGDQAARRHGRPRHRAADPADSVHGGGPARGGASCAPAGGVESFQALGGSLAAAGRGGGGGGKRSDPMTLKRRVIGALHCRPRHRRRRGRLLHAAVAADAGGLERRSARRPARDRSSSGAGHRRAFRATCRSTSTASAPRERSTP